MRPLALVLLLIGSLATQRALAENAPIQPPTRAHCVGVGMMWDENVNVCVVTRNTLSEQPLTRVDCGNEGMTWDENANICESESHLVGTTPRSNQPLTRASAIWPAWHRTGVFIVSPGEQISENGESESGWLY